MEYSARRRLSGRMKVSTAVCAVGLLLLALSSSAVLYAAPAVSFNLSTSRTFSPAEKPSIHLYARNVDELEFRIYHVQDPEKFLTGLDDLHSFGSGTPWGPKEQIDERTWLEKFHDWKHHYWFLIREFFRGQFSKPSRDALRTKQASLARRSRIVGVAQFAQIPLLNDKQLVARWRQEMPPTYVSDAQELPIDPLPTGMYLVEATDGHYKAYTLLMVSRMALVTRTTSGSVLAYSVDRQTGEPIANAEVKLGYGKQKQTSASSDADGLADLRASIGKEERENLWVVATSGNDLAVVTPSMYAFSAHEGSNWASYIYTDRPVYRPGHSVHWKAILRQRVENHLELPKVSNIHVRIADQENRPVFEKDLPVSASGTVDGDFVLAANASLGYYTILLGDAANGAVGEFHVEEYRKPEYQVRVSAAKPRVLQGESMQVVIDARYFFGEPVANGKVKYRVYRTPHYWWDREGDDGGGDGPDAEDGGEGGSLGYGADQQSEQTGKLDANGKMTVTIPTFFDKKGIRRQDEDYTLEAGVTDEANREITGRGRFLATYGSFRIHVEPVSYAVRVGQTGGIQHHRSGLRQQASADERAPATRFTSLVARKVGDERAWHCGCDYRLRRQSEKHDSGERIRQPGD